MGSLTEKKKKNHLKIGKILIFSWTKSGQINMGLNEEPPKTDDKTIEVEENESEEDEEVEDFDEDAYRALDAQLDQLNSVLDALEERSEQIHEKAKDLLKSNRESRKASSEPESKDQHQPMESSDS